MPHKGKIGIKISVDSFSSTPSREQATCQSSKLHTLNERTGILKNVSYNFQPLSKEKAIIFAELKFCTYGRFALTENISFRKILQLFFCSTQRHG